MNKEQNDYENMEHKIENQTLYIKVRMGFIPAYEWVIYINNACMFLGIPIEWYIDKKLEALKGTQFEIYLRQK